MRPSPSPLPIPASLESRGFTLVEMMIVVVIVGILALIGISGVDTYRRRTADATVKADLRNAMAAEEAYYADHQAYVAFQVDEGGSTGTPPFSASSNVTVAAELDGVGVRIEGSHSLSDNTWCISSAEGKLVQGVGC